MKECSSRIAALPPSGTIEIAREAAELWKQGKEIVALSMGEPDFPTPYHIVEAAVEAMHRGETHYVSSAGIPQLREAIAAKSQKENGIPCTADDVIVAPTKYALFLATAALVCEGDEIIIPDPAWVSYTPQIAALGGSSVPVPYGPGYRIDADAIMQAITPRTKAIVVNSPSNPLGAVATGEELRAVADIARDHDLYVITDEIYEKLIYEGDHISIASFDGMMERTITLNGFSKAYAMTGWRVGWAIAPKEIYGYMLKLQQHTLTCVPPFIQYAGIAALTGPQTPLDAMLQEFTARRAIVTALLGEVPGLSVEPPGGAFYVFPKYEQDIPSVALAKRLLHDGGVAVTPGSAFGAAGEGHFRISYATSRKKIAKGVEGIKRVFGGL